MDADKEQMVFEVGRDNDMNSTIHNYLLENIKTMWINVPLLLFYPMSCL